MSKCRNAVVENNADKMDENGVVDVGVTTDGSWHKRGHQSNFGIGTVIELDSGLLLDYEVYSKLCNKCIAKEKPWKRRK